MHSSINRTVHTTKEVVKDSQLGECYRQLPLKVRLQQGIYRNLTDTAQTFIKTLGAQSSSAQSLQNLVNCYSKKISLDRKLKSQLSYVNLVRACLRGNSSSQ